MQKKKSRKIDRRTIEKIKNKLIFQELNNKEELRAWVNLFFDIYLPDGIIDHESTASPLDAVWRVYELFKTGENKYIPQVTMLASRDSFKCQAKDSLLLTPKGFKKIQDVKIGDTVWSGWNWRKVTDWIDDGEKKSIKLTLRNGIELESTPIHLYWCLRNGVEQWIEAKNIKETDLICINTNTGVSNKNLNTNKEEYETGYFLGLLIGDGSVSSIESKTHKHFSLTSEDKNIIDFFHYYVQKYLGVKSIVRSNNKSRNTYSIWEKEAINKIKKLGIKPHRSWEKEIPEYCYKSHSAMIGFINGLFDTDGTFNSKNQVEIPITAKKVVYELQKILLSYGINAKAALNKRLFSYRKVKQNHIVHKLYIGSNEYEKLKNIGFMCKAEKAGSIYPPKIYDAHDTLPYKHIKFYVDLVRGLTMQIRNRKYIKPKFNPSNYRSITYGKLKDFIRWHKETLELIELPEKDKHYEAIKRMESILSNKWYTYKKKEFKKAHFFDLTVEKDHSYWSNGSISHNTLSASILEVLLMIHFRLPIVHMAAIKQQSQKSLEYVRTFFRKIDPYLKKHGWKKEGESKYEMIWVTDEGESLYLRTIAATVEAANGQHVPAIFIDEIDIIQDVKALAEAKLIPSMYKGYYPLTVYLSTRKFKGGLMEKTLKETEKVGGEILRWNILDITERITHEEAQVDKPKLVRYVTRELPMETLTEEEWAALKPEKQVKYEKIEAYAGIADHPLLPVMRNRLVDRPQEDYGNLYKPLITVNNLFKQTDPEMAEAQLLCRKPMSTNLVYPRFSEEENVLDLEEAYLKIFGDIPEGKEVTLEVLKEDIKKLGIPIIGGADWGFTNHTSFVILAATPSGDVFHLDTFSQTKMELSDIERVMVSLDKEWGVNKWYVDQAYPAYIKTLRKHGLKMPAFKKAVQDGIAAVQAKIVDSNNKRHYFIIRTPNNLEMIDAFIEYRWEIDAKGEIKEGKPVHDSGGICDKMDALRYPFQNVFGKKGNGILFQMKAENEYKATVFDTVKPQHKESVKDELQKASKQINKRLLREKIKNETGVDIDFGKIKQKGKIFWSD